MSFVDEVVEKKRCPECGCVGTNPGYDALTEDMVDEQFKTLIEGLWTLSADRKQLLRRFTCRNWKSAINFINEVAIIAEEPDVNHHPDIHLTKYRDIEVTKAS
jgi:pterin-4a-carbinolamine dehydratase